MWKGWINYLQKEKKYKRVFRALVREHRRKYGREKLFIFLGVRKVEIILKVL